MKRLLTLFTTFILLTTLGIAQNNAPNPHRLKQLRGSSGLIPPAQWTYFGIEPTSSRNKRKGGTYQVFMSMNTGPTQVPAWQHIDVPVSLFVQLPGFQYPTLDPLLVASIAYKQTPNMLDRTIGRLDRRGKAWFRVCPPREFKNCLPLTGVPCNICAVICWSSRQNGPEWSVTNSLPCTLIR